MRNRPTAAELIAAVRAFLESDALPKLDGRSAFHARVAVNALAIVERELSDAPAQDAAEHERLRRLLGRDGSLDELNRELCRRIRAGDVAPEAPRVRQHLWQTTLAKLAVDQPRYSAYRRARARRRAPE